MESKTIDLKKINLPLPLLLCKNTLFENKYPIFAILYHVPQNQHKIQDQCLIKLLKYPHHPFFEGRHEDLFHCVYKGIKTSLLYANQCSTFHQGMDWWVRIGNQQWILLNQMMSRVMQEDSLFVNYDKDPFCIVPCHFPIQHPPSSLSTTSWKIYKDDVLIENPEKFYMGVKNSLNHWKYQMRGLVPELSRYGQNVKKSISFEAKRTLQYEMHYSKTFQDTLHIPLGFSKKRKQKLLIDPVKQFENIKATQTERVKAYINQPSIEEKEQGKWNFFSEKKIEMIQVEKKRNKSNPLFPKEKKKKIENQKRSYFFISI